MKIQIDPKGPTRPTDYAWQEGLGCDHALQLHRSDMVEQLRFVHDELGIRSLRFHGIFDDDMWTIADLRTFSPMPGGGRVREVNFRQCGHVYDNLLSVGVKPFVELSFMPSQLARNGKTGLHYKNHTAPPKDWQEWGDYIRAFIRFLLDRYGAEEVESWWFEVWNEPDLTGFFSGTQKDYFKLYEVTARAVKSVDPKDPGGRPLHQRLQVDRRVSGLLPGKQRAPGLYLHPPLPRRRLRQPDYPRQLWGHFSDHARRGQGALRPD